MVPQLIDSERIVANWWRVCSVSSILARVKSVECSTARVASKIPLSKNVNPLSGALVEPTVTERV